MEHLTKPRGHIVAALSLTALLLLVPMAPRAGARTARIPSTVCSYDWRKGTWQVKQLIKCAARRWPVTGGPDKALSVAFCESRYDPSATGSGAAGVFQQKLAYWPTRARTYGFSGWSAYNGRANIIVSLRMAHRGGWGPWACA